MEVNYLLDTNTAIDYLDNKLPSHSAELDRHHSNLHFCDFKNGTARLAECFF